MHSRLQPKHNRILYCEFLALLGEMVHSSTFCYVNAYITEDLSTLLLRIHRATEDFGMPTAGMQQACQKVLHRQVPRASHQECVRNLCHKRPRPTSAEDRGRAQRQGHGARIVHTANAWKDVQAASWQQTACAEPVAKIESRIFLICVVSSAEAQC